MNDLFGSVRGPVLALGTQDLDTHFGRFRTTELRNLDTHRSAFVLVVGEVGGDAPLLARVHSSCVTSEFYGACDCDCAAQLDAALAALAAEGRGVLFYLPQEGRGAGLLAKGRDRMIVQASRHRTTTFEAYEHMGLRHDLRSYDEVAAACVLLEIRAPLLLLTNNPDKVDALEREKIRVAGTRPIEHGVSPFNAHYLDAKRRSGHALAEEVDARTAELPEPVECIEPEPLPQQPEIVRVASYLLPLAGERIERQDVLWVRAHFYADLRRGAELVVLTRGLSAQGGAGDVIARVQPEPQLERFRPLCAEARSGWIATLEQVVSRGAGIVAVASRDARGAPGQPERDGVLADLIVHHGAGRALTPLEPAGTSSLHAALAARGARVGAGSELARPGR